MERNRRSQVLAALEALYDQQGEAVYRYLLGTLGRREDAEDAMQTIWYQLARRSTRLLRVEDLPAYLWTAARNQARSIFRSRGRSRWTRSAVNRIATDSERAVSCSTASRSTGWMTGAKHWGVTGHTRAAIWFGGSSDQTLKKRSASMRSGSSVVKPSAYSAPMATPGWARMVRRIVSTWLPLITSPICDT